MKALAYLRINYKSDFILTLHSDAGWMTPFCIKFWTGAPSQAYFAGWDGDTYTHCTYDPSEPTKLLVQFDDHHLPIGDLKFQIAYHFTVADFPNDVEDEVLNQSNIVTEIDGNAYQVMLDFTGETAPEIQFSLPAYANEAQRIANEQQRISNEEQRIADEQTRIGNEETRINQEQTRQDNEAQRIRNEQTRINQEEARVREFATLKRDAQEATTAANDAAALANQKAQLAADKAQLAADKAALAQDAANLANQKAQLAADKAALAQDAADLANQKAQLAQQKAEYAQTQGDYAKQQGDYAKEQGDYAKEQGDTALADHQRAEADHGISVDDHTQAGNDHTRAEADHGISVDDHTQAGNDHTRAEADHGISVDDHTQAGNDHTRAEGDHTRAESDHAAVEVYVDSLGAFDISAYHATGGVLAKYADLTAALGTNGANIPDALRKGGMSVKYVQTSDNNYVQCRLMLSTFTAAQFTNPANWQGVDDEPTFGSNNLVKSGGVYNAIPLCYTKTFNYSHTTKGTKIVGTGYNFLKGHEYKITVDGTNESSAFATTVFDANGNKVHTISASIAAGNTFIDYWIPSVDYINAYIDAYFNAASGSVVYTIEDVSVSKTRDNLAIADGKASNAKGVNVTKSITTSGSGHSSTLDRIPLVLKAGDSFSFEITPGTAVVRDIHVYVFNGSTDVFVSDSLTVNKRYVFTVNGDADSIGVYFVNTTTGTISWNVVSGLQLAFEKIADDKSTLDNKALRTDITQTFTNTEKRTAYENLGLNVNEKRSVSYTNSTTGHQNMMSRLNLQKGHTYKVTVDTTGASNYTTVGIADANNNTIVTLSAALAANLVSEFYYTSDNDYQGAKLRGYFNGTNNTIVYSIEDTTVRDLNEEMGNIYPIFSNTFSVNVGGHSSTNNRLNVKIKAGTVVRLRLDAVTATLNNACAFYATDKNGNDVTLTEFGVVGEDSLIIPTVDLVKVGAYFTTAVAGTVRLTVDQSSYYSDKYLIDKVKDESTITGMNEDAFMKLDAVSTKDEHYGDHSETKYISMLMMTDSHTDWDRVNRGFKLGENAAFDLILHGGDIVEGSGGFATYNWKEKVLACNKPVLAITGNHEHTYVEGSTMYAGMTDEEVHNLLYDADLVSHNGEVHPTISSIEKNYYYKDITKNGITTRIIALYQFEWNSPVDGEGKPLYGSYEDRVFYTQEQIDWLVTTLKNTPSTTAVAIFSHIPISASKFLDNSFVRAVEKGEVKKDVHFLWDFMTSRTFLYSIIDAWVNGGTCNISTDQTTPDSVNHPLSVNTTFDGGGKFIGNICGHWHAGGFAYLVDENDEPSDYRVIISPTTSATYVQNTGWLGRKTSGFTQDCLNCIVYDYNRDKVKIVRFGAYVNNDGEECKTFTF